MKKILFLFLFLFIFLSVPVFVNASVIINEVAWMGTTSSTADEWVELYNNGNDNVNLNGWILTILDKKDILLAGNIPTNSFYLIERTNDDTVPNITADMISSFGTGLNNGGAVLILKNNQGTEMQKLDTSSGWPAGDNSTKQTMQWNGSSWITGDPTPRAANLNSTTIVEPEPEPTPGVGSSTSWPVEPQIFANAGEDKTAVAGADVVFTGKALGLDKEPLDGARFLWSFGDGSMTEGQNVRHVYKYPGEYIVVLDVSSGKYSASDRSMAKIIPNQLEIIEANQNYIKLHNGSNAELDISFWFLKAENSLFKFPANTFIKTNKDLMIDSSISGISEAGGKAELLYPNGSTAFLYTKTTTKSTTVVESVSKIEPKTDFGYQQKADEKENQAANIISSVQEKDNNGAGAGAGKWLAMASGVGVISAAGLIFIRRKGLL